MQASVLAVSKEQSHPPLAPRPSKWRRWLFRVAVLIYAIFLHALVIWAIWSPAGVGRLKKLIYNSPELEDEYNGNIVAQRVISRNLPDAAVVFLGDSRMREIDVAQVCDGPAINFSIGGDTTTGLLFRLPKYRNLQRSRLVVIGVGINDLSHYGDDEILSNFDKILTLLQSQGVQNIAVVAILPIEEGTYRQATSARLRGLRTTNERIFSVNRLLKEMCGCRKAVRFVDVNPDLSGAGGNLRSEYSLDGLHLSEAGNRVWGASLRRELFP